MEFVHYSSESESNGNVLESHEIGLLEKYHSICFILLFSSLASKFPLLEGADE